MAIFCGDNSDIILKKNNSYKALTYLLLTLPLCAFVLLFFIFSVHLFIGFVIMDDGIL